MFRQQGMYFCNPENGSCQFCEMDTGGNGAKVDCSNFCNKLLTTDSNASKIFLRYLDLLRDEVILLRKEGGQSKIEDAS